ncbi:MAG: ATP-binding protein [Myxococcales bacterium]|nr:ATP-binding protein [Myxococcales bacterium]
MPQRLPRRLSTRGAFLRRLPSARADGSYHRVLSPDREADVLVLDDFALAPLSEARRICSRSLSRAATALARPSSRAGSDPTDGTCLARPTVADAICDRVLHDAHKDRAHRASRRKTREESNPET